MVSSCGGILRRQKRKCCAVTNGEVALVKGNDECVIVFLGRGKRSMVSKKARWSIVREDDQTYCSTTCRKLCLITVATPSSEGQLTTLSPVSLVPQEADRCFGSANAAVIYYLKSKYAHT